MSVTPEMDQEEVARIVAKYDLVAVPVVDERHHLVGTIAVDDVIDIVGEEASEDIFRMAGSDAAELELLLGLLCLAIYFKGGGRLSVDHAIGTEL